MSGVVYRAQNNENKCMHGNLLVQRFVLCIEVGTERTSRCIREGEIMWVRGR